MYVLYVRGYALYAIHDVNMLRNDTFTINTECVLLRDTTHTREYVRT